MSRSLLAERRIGWSLMTCMFRPLGARPIRLTTAVGLSSPSMNSTPLYERRDHEASLDETERIVILANEPRPDAAILRSRTGLPHPVNFAFNDGLGMLSSIWPWWQYRETYSGKS